jgi:hypothetical protein
MASTLPERQIAGAEVGARSDSLARNAKGLTLAAI